MKVYPNLTLRQAETLRDFLYDLCRDDIDMHDTFALTLAELQKSIILAKENDATSRCSHPSLRLATSRDPLKS